MTRRVLDRKLRQERSSPAVAWLGRVIGLQIFGMIDRWARWITTTPFRYFSFRTFDSKSQNGEVFWIRAENLTQKKEDGETQKNILDVDCERLE